MDPAEDDEAAARRTIMRQAASISLAVAPFGVVFGVACGDAGLSVLHAAGFSLLVFAGSAQFAAVRVLGDGGTALAAIGAGLLLNVRSLAFGVLLAPDLAGPLWKRALLSQLVIDESTAVATTQRTRAMRRAGFLAGGVGVFVTWNLTTIAGATVASTSGDAVARWGLDAAGPAAFLALLWPRLTGAEGADARRLALVGAALAAVAVPLTPAGLPILLAGLAVVLPVRRRV